MAGRPAPSRDSAAAGALGGVRGVSLLETMKATAMMAIRAATTQAVALLPRLLEFDISGIPVLLANGDVRLYGFIRRKPMKSSNWEVVNYLSLDLARKTTKYLVPPIYGLTMSISVSQEAGKRECRYVRVPTNMADNHGGKCSLEQGRGQKQDPRPAR